TGGRGPSPEGVGGGHRRVRGGGQGARLQRIPLRAPRVEEWIVPRGPREQPLVETGHRHRVGAPAGADVLGTLDCGRSGGPEPERGERRRRGAARDVRPCGPRIPAVAGGAVLLSPA